MFMFTHGVKGGRWYSCRTTGGKTLPLTQQAEGFAAYPPQSTKGLHSAAHRRYRSATKYPAYPLPTWQWFVNQLPVACVRPPVASAKGQSQFVDSWGRAVIWLRLLSRWRLIAQDSRGCSKLETLRSGQRTLRGKSLPIQIHLGESILQAGRPQRMNEPR